MKRHRRAETYYIETCQKMLDLLDAEQVEAALALQTTLKERTDIPQTLAAQQWWMFAIGRLVFGLGDHDMAERVLAFIWESETVVDDLRPRLEAWRTHIATAEHEQMSPFILQTQLSHARQHHDTPREAAVLLALGETARQDGDYARTGPYLGAALRLYKAIEDQQGQAQTRLGLGRMAQAQGQYRSAQKSYRAALTLFEAIGDRHGQAQTLHSWLLTLLDAGDCNAAHERLQQLQSVLDDPASHELSKQFDGALQAAMGRLAEICE